MLSAGMRLGDRYRLDARIGSGGMGEVWRAVDEVLGRPVAVKVMLPGVADDPDFARRFLAEATAMARVNHPAVASIHDYGRSHDVTFLVMELVEGSSLAQILARAHRLGQPDTMRLIAQAADGLQAVHDCGIVHRDIKPANLLVRRDGSVVITDFGIARGDDASRLTASGAILGTPSYLSPEQVLGQPISVRSDVYALGLTAYECLAGERPFVGDNPYAVALQRVQSAPRTIGVTLTPEVLMVLERALATDPADRWPSAAALADAARRAKNSGNVAREQRVPGSAMPAQSSSAPSSSSWSWSVPASAVPASAGAQPGAMPGTPVAARSKQRHLAWLAGLLALLVIGGGAVWAVSDHLGRPRNADSASANVGSGPHGSSNGGSGSSGSGSSGSGNGGSGSGAVGAADAALRQAGYTPCGKAFCPAVPMCWAGLTEISGKAFEPERVDCAASHYWQTFAVLEIPTAAADAPPELLSKREDVTAACSAAAMASRSHHPIVTRSWNRDAWPIQLPASGVWLVHCLAGKAETTGSVF